MTTPHAPLGALAPVEWSEVPQEEDGLKRYVREILAEAQLVVESIPSPTSTTTTTSTTADDSTGRARSMTDSAVGYADVVSSLSRRTEAGSSSSTPTAPSVVTPNVTPDLLRKDWKEVKLNVRDNPYAIRVYKLASKDGKGAWFARRSVHSQLSFDDWRTGLAREFPETMKVQGSPGSGNIRGIGADRKVEQMAVGEAGNLSVFQLSAQFPGPTSPRDFITLLLTSDFARMEQTDRSSPLRQYMVVSKPCKHPDCPPRQGIIRGRYESVEVVREIGGDHLPRARSSPHIGEQAEDSRGPSRAVAAPIEAEPPRLVEWLMVTRSDPGGSVPRFMIEKGTPPGIVGDAGKFLDWASTVSSNEAQPVQPATNGLTREGPQNDIKLRQAQASNGSISQAETGNERGNSFLVDTESIPSSNGLYGIITGAFEAATSVAWGLGKQLSHSFESASDPGNGGVPKEQLESQNGGDDSGSRTDASSICSFTSAKEKSTEDDGGTNDKASDETRSQHPGDKELHRLEVRRRKLEDSHAKMRERLESKRSGEKEKDAAALAKMRDKHDREIAKQEAKYRRELRRIEERREVEERKAEARRKKAAEREERASLSLEVERLRAERDVAFKQMELLRIQVGELQEQNTLLVAKFGRMPLALREGSSSSREPSLLDHKLYKAVSDVR